MSATEQNNLQRIADQSRSLAEFYDQFLEHVCNELAAIGAVAWACSQTPMRAISQYQTAKDVPIKMQISERRHQELLDQGQTAAPFIETGDPTILFAKLPRGEAVDLIEVFLPAGLEGIGSTPAAKRLETICLAAKAITTRTATPSATSQDPQHSQNADAESLGSATKTPGITATQLDEYTHVLHQSLDPRATANKIANETRRLLDCDRVTVFRVTGKRVAAVAISGQPNVNRRSNAVARMERLAQRVLMTKQAFWYPPSQPQPPQIEQRLNEYLADASTRSMVISPIFDTAPSTELKPGDRDQPTPRLIGGVCIEQCDRQWDADAITAPVEILTRHSSDAFRNAYQHRQLFAYPLWHWLGKSKIIFAARHLPQNDRRDCPVNVTGFGDGFRSDRFSHGLRRSIDAGYSPLRLRQHRRRGKRSADRTRRRRGRRTTFDKNRQFGIGPADPSRDGKNKTNSMKSFLLPAQRCQIAMPDRTMKPKKKTSPR